MIMPQCWVSTRGHVSLCECIYGFESYGSLCALTARSARSVCSTNPPARDSFTTRDWKTRGGFCVASPTWSHGATDTARDRVPKTPVLAAHHGPALRVYQSSPLSFDSRCDTLHMPDDCQHTPLSASFNCTNRARVRVFMCMRACSCVRARACSCLSWFAHDA